MEKKNKDFVKAGNGVFYKNDKKEKDTQPDYTGPITIINKDGSERQLRISLWVKENEKYWGSFQVQEEVENTEDIPF
tara:strand:+ start:10151 stop:10381 length:231 start_codon:yes stop_codon:yes gene_type:complete